MNWTPTPGMKQAEKLMRELRDAAEACGVETSTALYPMYHARVFDLISKALDQALTEGQTIHRMPSGASLSFEGDGPSKIMTITGAAVQNGNGHTDFGSVHANGPYPGFDPVIEAHEEGPGAVPVAQHNALSSLLAETKQIAPGAFVYGGEEAPKKKRGRPPGPSKKPKAKKAKPAKAKAAKPAVVEDATGAADFVVAPAEASPEPTVEATP